jgi:serine beta-lactamase-like protein LACTB
MKPLLRIIAALLLGLTPATLGQVVEAPRTRLVVPEVDRAAAVQAIALREVQTQQLVGLSVAVAKDGEVLVESHLGYQDREARITVGEQTMYRWASISKPVTAVAAMQLAEAGKLDLDADVRTLVPEFPEKPWPVTTRQLLCHQGGIVHYSNGTVVVTPLTETVVNPYQDVILALCRFKESPLVNEPATAFSYSTHGYILASAVVERAADEKFWPFVRDRVAKPSGMSSFRPDYQWEQIEHRAVGYRKGRDSEIVRSTDTDVSWKLGGGGFISTVGDLSRFSIALMDNRLVKQRTFVDMCTGQKLKSGESTDYGLGLGVGRINGKLMATHSGGQEKAATYLLMVPTERLSIAVMCNTEGASLAEMSRELARMWLGGGDDRAP